MNEIGIEARRVIVGGVPIYIRQDTPDFRVAKDCLKGGEFDAISTLLPQLKYNFIVDAGGYIGTAAIAMARMFPSARIVTVEPSADNFHILKKNIEGFENITPINKAIVGIQRNVELRDPGNGEWGFSILDSQLNNKENAVLHQIDGITIDSLMSEFSVEGIDICKLDIEGAEIEVLDNSSAWLPKTTLLLAELHERIIKGGRSSFERATTGRIKSSIGKEKITAMKADF